MNEGAANVNIKKYLEEGRKYLEQGDPVQTSEKLYKASEEVIKTLSITYAPSLNEEAIKRGRWTTSLIFKAVREIAKGLKKKEVRYYWDAAWILHVKGFHEGKLDIDSIAERLEEIEGLVNLIEHKSYRAYMKSPSSLSGRS